jgi:orotate phosphoribosyltransferase-like protein
MPDTELMERVRELRERGCTPKEIARALRVPPATVAPLIRALGAAGGRVQRPQLIGCWANSGWSSSVTVEDDPERQELVPDDAESGRPA